MEKEIFNMYNKVRIGSNEKCDSCKEIGKGKLAGPISFFHIGSNFGNGAYKIVFVGKNTFYNKKNFENEAKGMSFAKVTETGRDSLKNQGDKCIKSSYWNYLRTFIAKFYNNLDEGIENIAITNLIKCNTTGEDNNYRDETLEDIRKNCIDFGIFENEIKILKPTHIIFFTGLDYDDYIKRFYFGLKQHQIKDNNKQIKLNNRKIIWWERNFYNNEGKIKLKILRTYHPGYLQRIGCKDSSIDKIKKWIETKG